MCQSNKFTCVNPFSSLLLNSLNDSSSNRRKTLRKSCDTCLTIKKTKLHYSSHSLSLTGRPAMNTKEKKENELAIITRQCTGRLGQCWWFKWFSSEERKGTTMRESKQKLLTTITAAASTTTEDAAAAAEHDRLTRSLANVVCGWCMPESKEQQQQHWQHRRRICRSAQPLTKRQWSTIWSLFCCCCCSAIFQDLVSTFSFTASARVAACGCVIGCCWCWCSSSRGHPKRERQKDRERIGVDPFSR